TLPIDAHAVLTFYTALVFALSISSFYPYKSLASSVAIDVAHPASSSASRDDHHHHRTRAGEKITAQHKISCHAVGRVAYNRLNLSPSLDFRLTMPPI